MRYYLAARRRPASIRENRRPFADIRVAASAALTTIMGSTAIYERRMVTWNELGVPCDFCDRRVLMTDISAPAPRPRAIAALALVLFAPLAVGAADERQTLPYRFLLVISNQWKDPASYVIEGGGEFQVIATLLKTWGLPFDVLRLDQQRLDRYHMIDREGRPLYGTIIWDADPSGLEGKDLSFLPSLVKDFGVNLVILGDTVSAPEAANLAGLDYISEYRLGDGFTFAGEHFITRGLAGREKEFLAGTGWEISGSKVAPKEATVLVKRAHLPFLTVHEFPGTGRVVWLGAHRGSTQISKQVVRDLFKRSLVWAQGYALYAEHPKSIILFMDDFGTSDRTYLPYWHYRTLNEEDIRKGLIEPLKRHHAVLNQDLLTGYVDRKARRIVNPWKQQVIDEIDGKTLHDYVSAKRGLDAGLHEGVFEIQCHGYTHMLPDLESPPGPFWTAPMDGTGTLGFDVEFGDELRNKEVPAITQKFLLSRGIENIRKDFGVTPLFVINGGGAWSKTYPNNSPRIAAEMGFGLSNFGSPGYLGIDLVISPMEPVVQRTTWAYDRKLSGADIPWTMDAPYFIIFHDRDISLDITAAERLLTSLGNGVRYLSANEYCGYLHAWIERADETVQPLSLAVNYDDHYCQYFASHESAWILHLSDETRRGLKNAVPEKQTIILPKGLGRHVVNVERPAK